MRTKILTIMFMLCLLASCGKERTDAGDPLPEGAYPVTLAASIEAQTRSTADNSWDGGELVTVQAVSGEDGEWSTSAETGLYTAVADGTLSPYGSGSPFWWTNSSEKKKLRAWHCGGDSAGAPDAGRVPSSWTVESDQSGEGYANSDLLFAPCVTVSFGSAAALTFRHQTAKIVVNILKADAVTDAGQILSLTIGDGDIESRGSFAAPEIGDFGDWTSTSSPALCSITPRRLDSPTDANLYAASYEALVIPQATAGKYMVTVTTALGKLRYVAPAGAGALEPGKAYTYDITVKSNGLEVKAISGAAWTSGGDETVTVVKKGEYTADQVKCGDYIYSDGTTSDGGLRKRYTDGTAPEIADPKPAPLSDKTLVGIVFWTESEEGDATLVPENAKDRIMATEHPACTTGLAVAIANASTYQTYWQESKESVCSNFQWKSSDFNPSKTEYKSVYVNNIWDDNYGYILGYQNTKVLKAYNDYCSANAKSSYCIRPVTDLGNFSSAPEGSTGWYIPSIKELHILCCKDITGSIAYENGSEAIYSETAGIVNGSIEAAKSAGYTSALTLGGEYWSSTEKSGKDAQICLYIGGDDSANVVEVNKASREAVLRPVCAF